MAVTFHFQHPVKLPFRRKLKNLVNSLFKEETIKLGTLDIIFCSDSFLLEINKSHLGHDYFTDIITFDYSEDEIRCGEIYISVETASSNAKYYKVLLYNELTRLIIHGCLHLCGYLDKSKDDRLKMRNKEDHYLTQFSLL